MTEDGGDTWELISNFTPGVIDEIDQMEFLNETTGAAIGYYVDMQDSFKVKSKILVTENGGIIWEVLYNHDSHLRKIFLFDANNCWAVGTEGTIVKFSIDGSSSIDDEKFKKIPGDTRLYQNYPNPFNPATTFKYYLHESNETNLKIYNLAGQEIETLVNESQKAGEYTINWNADALPSGIYFYKLHTGKFSKTKKLILLK